MQCYGIAPYLKDNVENHMTIPAFLFALLIALLYGAIYHFLRGGSLGRLLLYLALSIFGFAAGHLVGLWRGWIFFPLGSLNLGMSSVGSVLVLLVGDWLSHIESNRESKV